MQFSTGEKIGGAFLGLVVIGGMITAVVGGVGTWNGHEIVFGTSVAVATGSAATAVAYVVLKCIGGNDPETMGNRVEDFNDTFYEDCGF